MTCVMQIALFSIAQIMPISYNRENMGRLFRHVVPTRESAAKVSLHSSKSTLDMHVFISILQITPETTDGISPSPEILSFYGLCPDPDVFTEVVELDEVPEHLTPEQITAPQQKGFLLRMPSPFAGREMKGPFSVGAGDMLFFNNHRTLHARQKFEVRRMANVRVWERPADLTAVLDEITQNPDDYPYIDTDRIAALGFSAGGYTAMAVSGARVDPVALQGFCDTTDHGMSDCAFLKRGGVDLHAMDLSPASQDLTDPRIRAAVIIDPGIVETLTDESLAQIRIPMLIVNLGAQGKVPIGVDATHAVGLIPNAQFARIDDAFHFSFLAECKPKGPAILAQEGEMDLLCDDSGGRGRAALHTELQGLITAYLKDVL